MRPTACSTPWSAATRRDILRRTIAAEQSVSALAADYDMSFAAVQKHVAVLEAARPHRQARRGTRAARPRRPRHDRPRPRPARPLRELWRARIDRLDALLAGPDPHATSTDRTPDKGD
ncbi:transcriptional regulator [Microbacterium aurum]